MNVFAIKKESEQLCEKKNNCFCMLFVACIVSLLLLPILRINQRGIPYIYNDEFGYWFNAAEFVGLDWTETFSRISYYSFGYSFLLASLIKIFSDTATAYRYAVFLNGIWLSLSFVFLYNTAKIIYEKTNKYVILVASLAATLYSSNIAEINYTWPEVFLFMLFCLILYLITSLCKKPSFYKTVALAFFTVYSYFVHQRTLGICITIVIVVFILFFTKTIKPAYFASYIIVSCLILAFLISVKQDVISGFWLDSSTVNGNDFSGQTGKIAYLLTVEGVRDLVFSLLGKLYYVFSSSFFLAPFALYIIIYKWIIKNILSANYSIKLMTGIFLTLAFMFSIGINSIFMINIDSVSHLVYGRYIDNLMGPLILIGIFELPGLVNQDSKKISAFLFALLILLSYVVSYCILRYDLSRIAAINNIGISYLVDTGLVKTIIGIVCVFGIWLIMLLIKYIYKKNNLVMILISFILIILFTIIGRNAYYKFETVWGSASESSQNIVDDIKLILEENPEADVYVINDVDGGYPGKYVGNGIQFLLSSYKIYNLDLISANNKEWTDNCIIISYVNSVYFSEPLDGFEVIYIDDVYKVQVSSNLN